MTRHQRLRRPIQSWRRFRTFSWCGGWWDGKCAPATWLRRLLHQNEYLDSITSREYRGESNEYMPSEDTLAACRYRRCYGCARCWISADRFGPDFRPVGPAACARRGCSGCCYCRGDKSLPVYLQVCTTYNYYHQEHNYYGRYQNGGPSGSAFPLYSVTSTGYFLLRGTALCQSTSCAAKLSQLGMAVPSAWPAPCGITFPQTS